MPGEVSGFWLEDLRALAFEGMVSRPSADLRTGRSQPL